MNELTKWIFAPTILLAASVAGGCGERTPPRERVAIEAPETILLDGVVWTREALDAQRDPRLAKLFRERSDLTGSPNLTGTLVAYAAPDDRRTRFYWIDANAGGQSWFWIETDADGSYRDMGDGVGERFPAP